MANDLHTHHFMTTEIGLLLILSVLLVLAAIVLLFIQFKRKDRSKAYSRVVFYCLCSALVLLFSIQLSFEIGDTILVEWHHWLTELRGERRIENPRIVQFNISQHYGKLNRHILLRSLEFLDNSGPRVIGLTFNPSKYGVESDSILRLHVRHAKLAYYRETMPYVGIHNPNWDKNSETTEDLANYVVAVKDFYGLYYTPHENTIYHSVPPFPAKLVRLASSAADSLLANVPTNARGFAVINPYKNKKLWQSPFPHMFYDLFAENIENFRNLYFSGIGTRGRPASDTVSSWWRGGIVDGRLDLDKQSVAVLQSPKVSGPFIPIDTMNTLGSLSEKIIIVSVDGFSSGTRYGTEIQNIIDQDFLREPDVRWYPLISLFFLLLFHLVYSRLHPWIGCAAMVGSVVVGILGLVVLFMTAHVLVNPYPVLVSLVGGILFFFPYELGTERIRLMADGMRLASQLKAAHDMQMGLMPTSDPSISGFDVSGMCRPAHEVGGDYFDYVWLNEKKTRMGIAIADVSGKAMKAAMTAVMTSGMVYREIGHNQSPKEILREINRPMYLKTDKRVFTAMSFAVIDTMAKSLAFSNAGQMQPLLKRNGQIESLKVDGARLPLGMAEDVEYEELTVSLQSGDMVVFYTDGIPEAMNAKNEMFGFERLEAIVKEITSDLSAKQVAANIVEEVGEFTGSAKQHDDMTVVVVKVS